MTTHDGETSFSDKPGHLIEELETINKRAFGMALSVHNDPRLRVQLSKEAGLLEKRLLSIADELEQVDAVAHKEWFHRISESILDLNFAKADVAFTSLRLGDHIKWGK